MEATVLFDASGNILAMLHSHPDTKSSKESVKRELRVTFRPTDKLQTATLDIPSELQHLKPSELHKSIRVDRRGGTPRLVSRTKDER